MSEPNPYFTYNLPLQVWPSESGGDRILNYMPRKETCRSLDLDECRGEQSRADFLNEAAMHLENLARLMRAAAADPTLNVYYHDEGFEDFKQAQGADR